VVQWLPATPTATAAIAAATTAAATAATGTIAATAAAGTAKAAHAWRPLARFAHGQSSAVQLGAVQLLNGGIGIRVILHLYETEATAPSCLPIGNHICGYHRANLLKVVPKLL